MLFAYFIVVISICDEQWKAPDFLDKSIAETISQLSCTSSGLCTRSAQVLNLIQFHCTPPMRQTKDDLQIKFNSILMFYISPPPTRWIISIDTHIQVQYSWLWKLANVTQNPYSYQWSNDSRLPELVNGPPRRTMYVTALYFTMTCMTSVSVIYVHCCCCYAFRRFPRIHFSHFWNENEGVRPASERARATPSNIYNTLMELIK